MFAQHSLAPVAYVAAALQQQCSRSCIGGATRSPPVGVGDKAAHAASKRLGACVCVLVCVSVCVHVALAYASACGACEVAGRSGLA